MKTKEELLIELQKIANKMNSLKSTIEEMLKEFDELEKEYFRITEEITKQ